jgi:hypothetical protein
VSAKLARGERENHPPLSRVTGDFPVLDGQKKSRLGREVVEMISEDNKIASN